MKKEIQVSAFAHTFSDTLSFKGFQSKRFLTVK